MRALFSKSCAELSLAALVLILLSPFPASAVTAHSQRTFTYIINPVHTDLYFTTSKGGSALDSGAEIEITDTSSSTIQYYLHFSSNEMGTHSVTVTVTPLVQTVSGTEVAIPHTVSVLDVDSGFEDAVDSFNFVSDNTATAITGSLPSVEVTGAQTETRDYAFIYDFGTADLSSLPAGTFESTATLEYTIQ